MYEETECQDAMYLRWAEHLQRTALQQAAAATTAAAEATMAAESTNPAPAVAALVVAADAGAAKPDRDSNGVELTRVEHVMSKRNLLIKVTR